MMHPRPLVFLLVHGIGPQDAPFQEEFLQDVAQATRRHLERQGQPALQERLVTLRADWSHLFSRERTAWLGTLFPEHTSRGVTNRRIARMLLWTLALPILVALGTGIGMFVLRSVAGWVIGMVVGILAAAVIGWKIIIPRFPWGDLWTFGRPFEANTISDLILYESDGPRQAILEQVLAALEPALPYAYALGKDAGTTCLPVVLAGHSLGSVVVYDILLGVSARGRGLSTSVQRQLTAGGPPERMAFLRRAEIVQRTLCPLGIITLGSPIALFLFRKPEVTTRRDLWRTTLPPLFGEDGAFAPSGDRLRWRWQNFWHGADFVAHRLEPFFDDGYPGKFVEDVRIHPLAEGPVAAHSTYWTDQHVIGRIGQQLAEVLLALP
jgi:hypothetical protein